MRRSDHQTARDPTLRVDPSTLERIPLFAELGRDASVALLERVRGRVAVAGESILEEGEPGHALFAIVEGVVRVERRVEGEPVTIDQLARGEIFGEMSLLSRCPRLASVAAVTRCELLELGRAELETLVALHPGVGEVIHRLFEQRLLANVLRASPVFREIPAGERPALAQLFTVSTCPSGALLLEQGEPARGFFVLLRGRCDVFHRDADGHEEPYPAMTEGDVFGEVSLLQGGPATACVRAATPCIVVELHREWFDRLLHDHPGVRAVIYEVAAQRLGRTQQLLAKELITRSLV